MSSWRYAFMFPQSPSQLRPANSVKHLTAFGAEYADSIRFCIPIDDKGHLLNVGDEVALREPREQDLIYYLQSGRSFSIELKSAYMPISINYILNYTNSHIYICWSNHLFDISPKRFQSEFWKALRSFAKDCNAGYVVIVDDAPDHFEDRFIEIDSKRLFDVQVTHRYGLSLREVWLQSSLTSTLPDGVSYGDSEKIGEGFERYIVVN